MKKITIIFIVLVASIALSSFIFYKSINRKFDLTLQSIDGKVKYTFGKICNDEPKAISDFSYECVISNLSLDKLFTDKFEGDLVYLDDDNNTSTKVNKRCYICVDNHYFYFEICGENKLIYRELIAGFYPENSEGGVMISPFYDKEGLMWEQQNILSWNDTVGLNSFEDLVEFYKKTDSSLYEINEEKRSIIVKLFWKNELTSSDSAEISVDGEQIVVQLQQNKEGESLYE